MPDPCSNLSIRPSTGCILGKRRSSSRTPKNARLLLLASSCRQYLPVHAGKQALFFGKVASVSAGAA